MRDVQRFLVKLRSDAGTTAFELDGAAVAFELTPLLPSMERDQRLGAGQGAKWHVLTPKFALDGMQAWDVCHALVSQGLGFGGEAPEFAEPDIQQRWAAGSATDEELALNSACSTEPQDLAHYPGDPADKLWHRNDRHGQFNRALAVLTPPTAATRVRVAHLDTGFDPDHQSLPAHIERDLQRNFVDPDRPNDAHDDSSGALNNLGHGTGTLSILAGQGATGLTEMGAAPFANVVPIRVADRVVLFYNSAIARALDYVHSLTTASATPVQVVSMSLGGLPSQAWADAVNALYDAGVVVVAAAGNNFGNLPTQHIVYPARFNRAIAVCGVMADDTPYADLPLTLMAGNYGPPSKMRTAMAAYTPNIAWAKFGCPTVARFNGGGTSAATPQVAAAALIWIQQHLQEWRAYPEAWMRVEAVRKALFSTANAIDPKRLGRGELRAFYAVEQAAAAASDLVRENPDSAAFPILKVLTGLGVQETAGARWRMLELEALQLSQSAGVAAVLPDPDVNPAMLSATRRLQIAAALANHPRASRALREALAGSVPSAAPTPVQIPRTPTPVQELHLRHALTPSIPLPNVRRLRTYAYDPSLGMELETSGINEATLEVRWEADLAPGPIGEYVEVIDIDPPSRCSYAPVDLGLPQLLAADGLAPSESNPQFHQQMVYAVAMKTIEHFERALGRVALWSPRFVPGLPTASDPSAPPRETYVQRLRIYPHALRMENAFYSPDRKALLLGYFAAQERIPNQLPGQLVFAALSHDIIAHETTHAVLDGLHRRFREATNPDVLAFHEAFADIVALFQHFTMPESLRDQIAQSRGDLRQENLLGKLAVQFGQATGHYGALRDYIGTMEDDPATGGRRWKVRRPSAQDYQASTESHVRGAVLVAAAFDAFLRIYTVRAMEIIKLATGGTGVLPPGAIPVPLADALSDEASKVAGQVLTMCIRGLDYCPPVDITFGDYLRAVITADRDLVPNDVRGYRVALVAAFRDRGIFPSEVKSISANSLVWEPPPLPLKRIDRILPSLALDWDLQSNRQEAWDGSRQNAAKFWAWLMNPDEVSADELAALGLRRDAAAMTELINAQGKSIRGRLHGIEVHRVRPTRRVGPDGQMVSQLVIEVTQSFYPEDRVLGVFRGGVTLLVDMRLKEVKYLVRKRLDHPARISTQQQFGADWTARYEDNYFASSAWRSEPFAILHRGN
jgi:subtilisin family serine protease